MLKLHRAICSGQKMTSCPTSAMNSEESDENSPISGHPVLVRTTQQLTAGLLTFGSSSCLRLPELKIQWLMNANRLADYSCGGSSGLGL